MSIRIIRFVLVGFLGFACSQTKPYVRPELEDCSHADPQPADVRSRIILFGDGGDLEDRNAPILDSLQSHASWVPSRTTVVLLGDNIYPAGLPDSSKGKEYRTAKNKLEVQLRAIEDAGARGIVIPGNHDWDYSGPDGWNAILRQADLAESISPRIRMLPFGGCPGPEVNDYEGVRLLVLDSEWWLRKLDKPVAECFMELNFTSAATRSDSVEILKKFVLSRMVEAISTSDRPVLVVAHHPLQTYGPHGGFFEWKDYLFPLTNLNSSLWIPSPVLLGGLAFGVAKLVGGSNETALTAAAIAGAVAPFVYPLGRKLLRHDQDLGGSGNKEMVGSYRSSFVTADPENEKLILYAAGHDHSLQVLEGGEGEDFVLVSGAGSKASPVGKGDKTLFAHQHKGFMQLDFLADDHVVLSIVEPEGSKSLGKEGLSICLK